MSCQGSTPSSTSTTKRPPSAWTYICLYKCVYLSLYVYIYTHIVISCIILYYIMLYYIISLSLCIFIYTYILLPSLLLLLLLLLLVGRPDAHHQVGEVPAPDLYLQRQALQTNKPNTNRIRHNINKATQTAQHDYDT